MNPSPRAMSASHPSSKIDFLINANINDKWQKTGHFGRKNAKNRQILLFFPLRKEGRIVSKTISKIGDVESRLLRSEVRPTGR